MKQKPKFTRHRYYVHIVTPYDIFKHQAHTATDDFNYAKRRALNTSYEQLDTHFVQILDASCGEIVEAWLVHDGKRFCLKRENGE